MKQISNHHLIDIELALITQYVHIICYINLKVGSVYSFLGTRALDVFSIFYKFLGASVCMIFRKIHVLGTGYGFNGVLECLS